MISREKIKANLVVIWQVALVLCNNNFFVKHESNTVHNHRIIRVFL